MGFVHDWYTAPGKGVAKDAPRKKGGARFLELTLRDGWHFLGANLLVCLFAAPGAFLAVLCAEARQPLWTVLAGGVGGALAAPFLSGLYDTLLRALRDEAGFWWYTYRKALRRNALASLVPGALFGALTAGQVFALTVMLRENSGTAFSFAALFLGLLLAAAVQLLFWPQLVLMELPLPALLKNCLLLTFAYPQRALAAALLWLAYWGAMLALAPLSLFAVPILGVWYIALAAAMMVYPPLESAFHIEETIYAMKFPQVETIMHDHPPAEDPDDPPPPPQ